MRFVVGNFWSAPRVSTRARTPLARLSHSGIPKPEIAAGGITTPLRDYRRERLDATPANDPSATRRSA